MKEYIPMLLCIFLPSGTVELRESNAVVNFGNLLLGRGFPFEGELARFMFAWTQ